MQSDLDTDIDYNKNIVLDDEKNATQITTQSRLQIIAKWRSAFCHDWTVILKRRHDNNVLSRFRG